MEVSQIITNFAVVNTVLMIILYTLITAVFLLCGSVLWLKRKEVPDQSRTFLATFGLISGLLYMVRLVSYVANLVHASYHELMPPLLVIGGLIAITLFLTYPVEVIRPGLLRGWRILVPFLPAILLTLPSVVGLEYRVLLSFADLKDHLLELNVLLRLLGLAILLVISLLLLVIPYNWRTTSADSHWILRTALIAQGISVFYFPRAFSTLPIMTVPHLLWCIFAMGYYTYYELSERLLPVTLPEVGCNTGSGKGDLWQQICTVMDLEEAWRNPDMTAEALSRELGTNRIYVARAIKEHTGMTFNNYLNSKRVEYIASLLHQNPSLSLKEIFFAAGFRSRDTANRNFLRFKGCSPTDYREQDTL